MRIVAGKWGSRRLQAPAGRTTRPTQDKIREAVFDSLGGFFEGGTVLDLYAGSGAVGLEALSRGMAAGVFVEASRPACQVLRANIHSLGAQACCRVLAMKAEKALPLLAGENSRFDLVYLDPPYRQEKNTEVMRFLTEKGMLAAGAVAVIEAAKEDSYPPELGNMALYKEAVYGITRVLYYHGKEAGI